MKVRTTISIDFVYDDEELTSDGDKAVTEGSLQEYFNEDRILEFMDNPESLSITNLSVYTNK